MSGEELTFSQDTHNETEMQSGPESSTSWSSIANEAKEESWEEHIAKANDLKQEATQQISNKKISLEKQKIQTRDKDGNLIESTLKYAQTHTTEMNRYPAQEHFVEGLMRESYEKGQPLRVLNIGVSDGQEALSYTQMAADVAGENSIDKALDLELVEYDIIPLIEKSRLKKDVPDAVYNHLKSIYNTPKAHFDTPFQSFVKELKDKNEKRDVVLFNNVIQHLDYSVPEEKMLEDMQNLIDVVDNGGTLCMSCKQNVLNQNPKVSSLFSKTVNMLQAQEFVLQSKSMADDSSDHDFSVVFQKK